jgi:tetratricopeptide (TPR) repeat protein/predicted MPP superfamily phosphohydrolase
VPSRLRILHISDLHGRSATGPQGQRARREAPFRERVIGEAWNANLQELREDGVKFDLVAFTGDLGDWGDPTDYSVGIEFLRRTCALLDVPLERLFLVPGNHDVARGIGTSAWEEMRKRFGATGRAGSDWMAGGSRPGGLADEWRDAVLQRQQAFWKVIEDDLERGALVPGRGPHGRLGYRAEVTIPGLGRPAWVSGLDTAWLAGDNDDTGALRLTEHQVALLTNNDQGQSLPGFRLALMHHRFADLADGEVARRLLADRVDLVLHGHQHEPAVEPWSSPDQHLLVLAAGCLYEGDDAHRYPNACQVIDAELDDDGRPQHVTVRFRGWAQRAAGLFWGDDALLYHSARGGRLTLRRDARGWSASRGQRARPWEPQEHHVFVGRADEVAALDRAFAIGPTARVAVQGMPGVGKTYLVEEWCATRRKQFGPLCRWVMDPLSPTDATAALRQLASQAGIDPDRTLTDEVPDLLAERSALVHVDNVDSSDAAGAVAQLLAMIPRVPAIVTGRYTGLATSAASRWQRVEVDCFEADRGVELIQSELGDEAPKVDDLRSLVAHVGGLPLALHLAAGYLRGGYTVADFVARLSASGLSLEHVDRADPLWQERSRGVVSLSFQISRDILFKEAGSRGSEWGAALGALAWAAASGFGREIGSAITDLSDDDFAAFIQTATTLSLLRGVKRAADNDRAWAMHLLVAEFLRQRPTVATSPPGDEQRALAQFIRGCVRYAQEIDLDDGFRRWRREGLQLTQAIHYALAHLPPSSLATITLLDRAGTGARSSGDLATAQDYLTLALERSRLHRGERDLVTATIQSNLALVLHDLHELGDSRELLDASLSMTAAILGEMAPDTASRRSNLALVLKDQGELDAAIKQQERALEATRQHFGADDRRTTTMESNLAIMLYDKGDLPRARDLLEHALAYDRRNLAEPSRVVAIRCSNLAGVYKDLGELPRALELMEEAVSIDRLTIGSKHPEMCRHLANLAGLVEAVGDIDRALTLAAEALACGEDSLGPAHPRVGEVRLMIAMLLLRLQRPDEALAQVERALASTRDLAAKTRLSLSSTLGACHFAKGDVVAALDVWRPLLPVLEQTLGPDDAALDTLRFNVAIALERIGKHADAQPLLEIALERNTRLDADGQRTRETAFELAQVLRRRGRLDEASALMERVIASEIRMLGEDAALVADHRARLADVRHAAGDLAHARRLHEQALDSDRRRLGDEDPLVAQRLSDLALVLRDMGELVLAERLLERAVTICTMRLPPDDQQTALTLYNLAAVLESAGKVDEAHDALTRTIAMLEGDSNQRDPLAALARARRARIIHGQGDTALARGELAMAVAAVRGRTDPLAAAVRLIAVELGIAVTSQQLLGEQ